MGMGYVSLQGQDLSLMSDIVIDNCAICRNHIMDLCTFIYIESMEWGLTE
jgi:hypothetical protein